jgi:hypothetical protein
MKNGTDGTEGSRSKEMSGDYTSRCFEVFMPG